MGPGKSCFFAYLHMPKIAIAKSFGHMLTAALKQGQRAFFGYPGFRSMSAHMRVEKGNSGVILLVV